MLTYIITLLAGFLLLVWGADRFVIGAAATARVLGVSPLLIGMTIVGFGTSAPEILVSANAAISGKPGLAIGNAIGSNIANLALIIGTTALVAPLIIRSNTLRRELTILLVVTLVSLLPFLDNHLGRADGVGLLIGLVAILFWIARMGMQSRDSDPMLREVEAEIPSDMKLNHALAWLTVGLVVLLTSSRALVWAASGIAEDLGVSDLVIGLTIVAIGTSLPELAASVSAALKNEHDLAIGNVIGSNIYNLLAVLGVAAIIRPTGFDPAVLSRDFPVMIVLTIALFAMAYGTGDKGRITRLEGFALLLVFVGYQLFIMSQLF